MILDRNDPHRGRRGHHHDRHRSSHGPSSGGDLVRRCCVLAGDSEADRLLLAKAEHLAASFDAQLLVADLQATHEHRGFLTSAIADLDCCLHKPDWYDREDFLRLARSSDIVIVDERRAGTATAFATLGGRPVLVVPPSLAAERIGSRAVIFWNDRGCCAAALRDVMPLLRDAYTIAIVGEQAEPAVSYLEGHGFAVEVIRGGDFDTCNSSADLYAGDIPAAIVASRREEAALLLSPSW